MSEAPPTRGSILRSPWIWAFLAGVVLLTAIRPLLRRDPPPPPVLGRVPPFTLIDSAGATFGSETLGGVAYVVNFFSTRCTSDCPAAMRAMKRLQDVCDESGIRGIRLLSITVDPGFDTPERLRAYGASLGVNPDRWKLLTGDDGTIRRLAVEGFEVPAGADHTRTLILVDPSGRRRGAYGPDDLGLEEIYGRARQVLRK